MKTNVNEIGLNLFEMEWTQSANKDALDLYWLLKTF